MAAIVSSTSPSCSGYIAGREGAKVRRLSRRHIGHTVGVDEAFPIVVIVVVVVASAVAIISSIASGGLYERIGKGSFSMDEPSGRAKGPAPGTAAYQAEADEEIRQLVEAKSARREARGEAPLDIDAEIAALKPAPAAPDEGLRQEVREHVIARNERRERRGQPPLDVEQEVERQLRDLG